MRKKGISRRRFVQQAASGVAFTIVPAHVLGRGHVPPSDKLNIACIGVGGMGANDVRGVGKTENIYALCDVDERQGAPSFAAFPKAKRYKDFRALLDKEGKSIDAVTVSTPDHTHTVAGMMAMKLGKHTRIQKPLARTLWEVKQLEEAATKYKVATQMGNQGHAEEGTRQIREWVEAGAIGTVREIQLWTNRPIWPQALDRPLEEYYTPPWIDWDLWLGPAPERPYNPAYAPFRWRGWWDYGTGALGDMACHLLDAAYWILDLGYPSRVESETSQLFAETAPKSSRVTFTFPARGTRPAVTVVWRDGALVAPRPSEWPASDLWPFGDDGGQLWIGDDGKMVAGVYAENPKLLNAERMAAVTAHPLEVRYPRIQGGSYAEFINGVRTGTPCGSDFANHATGLTEMVLLGCLAQRIGSVVDLDAATGRILTSLPEDWLSPTYRSGFRQLAMERAG